MPDSIDPILPESERKKTPVRIHAPPIVGSFGLSKVCQAQEPYGLGHDIFFSLREEAKPVLRNAEDVERSAEH